jgi:hypothetical protein
MKGRNALIALAVVAVVAVASLLWLGGNLDALVRKGVERYGPRITGTPVRLAGAEVRLREGRATLRELRIANPESFSDADAISLGEITLDIDPGSLTSEPIRIETIRVAGPSLLLEITEGGGINLRELKGNVDAYAPTSRDGSGAPAGETESDPPPRLVVEELTVEGGRLALDATAVGGERSERELGSFTLRDLGGTEGVPADQMGKELLRAVLGRALERGALDELERKAKDALGEAADGLIDRIGGN